MDSDDDSHATQVNLWVPDVVPFQKAARNNPMYMGPDRLKEYRAALAAMERKGPRATKGLITFNKRGHKQRYGHERAEDGKIIRCRRLQMSK